jgi:hypothetical protein
VVKELYRRGRTRRSPIRLLGVALSNLGLFDEQLPLFAEDQRRIAAVDAVRERFGYDAVRLAASRPRSSHRTDHR